MRTLRLRRQLIYQLRVFYKEDVKYEGNIKSENLEHIVIDAGVVYLNYGIEGEEKLLAPCKGDNTFSVEAEIRR